MPKYVVSSTLDRADWRNTTIISGDLLFRDGSTAKLRLLRTRTFGSGLVVLPYQPVTGSAA